MKKKILIYTIVYNHEKFIEKTLSRIPDAIYENYDCEILVSDDKSSDNTRNVLKQFSSNFEKKAKITICTMRKNQGMGGNQKIGYYYAIKNKFDIVVLLHGDGQYAPEYLPKLLENFNDATNDAVFGSRMMQAGAAIQGGMPLYKYYGNKILTSIQNFLLKSNLSEFHSGYRIYRVNVLEKIYFEKNSNYYDFDTEIIVQLLTKKFKIKEVSIPTFYGDEISYVNGIKYAIKIIFFTVISQFHEFKIIEIKKLLRRKSISHNDICEDLKEIENIFNESIKI